jgi:glycosyltransferase involved in cell wall biosynthesis
VRKFASDFDGHVLVLHELRAVQVQRLQLVGFKGVVLSLGKKLDGAEVLPHEENSLDIRFYGWLSILLFLSFSRKIHAVEINEPFFLRSTPLQLLVIFSNWVACTLCRARKRYVLTYAIENLNIIERLQRKGRVYRWASTLVTIVARFIFRRLSAVVYGTRASKDNYENLLGDACQSVRSCLIPPLEPICSYCEISSANKTGLNFLFLGAFDHRKGVEHVMRIWPEIQKNFPHATLSIIGQGPRVEEVSLWVSTQSSVTLEVAPPRQRIHEALSSARFLFLMSNRTQDWIEQVGLPILEGLSHRCWILSSSSTGIADWLSHNGHFVVDVDTPAFDAALLHYVGRQQLKTFDADGALPKTGGRELAHHWLHKI